jgi:4-hydroxy-tetrahydrodipicolinate reductase
MRVAVIGSAGRLGRVIAAAIAEADDLELIEIPGESSMAAIADAEAAIDVSRADPAHAHALACAERGLPLVIGASGLGAEQLAEIADAAQSKVAIRLVPNFSLGAIASEHVAALIAEHFASVEIVETHHAGKRDAPSGTAIATARALAAARSNLPPAPDATVGDAPARGALIDGVPVHSLRLPGVMARQDVVFSSAGESVTISHDVIDRSAYVPGALLAVRRGLSHTGLVVGLRDLLGL